MPLYDRLTGREEEVLALVKKGYSNPRIAEELWVNVKAVEKHMANLYAKHALFFNEGYEPRVMLVLEEKTG